MLSSFTNAHNFLLYLEGKIKKNVILRENYSIVNLKNENMVNCCFLRIDKPVEESTKYIFFEIIEDTGKIIVTMCDENYKFDAGFYPRTVLYENYFISFLEMYSRKEYCYQAQYP